MSGIRERDPEIQCQLLDANDKPLDSANFHLDGKLIAESVGESVNVVGKAEKTPDVYEGSISWTPKIPDFGYYRVLVNLLRSKAPGDRDESDRRLDNGHEVWLAVVPSLEGLETPSRGEFGWVLPQGDHPLSLDNLCRLLPHAGISWVKLPVWYNPADPRRGDDLIRFVELLGASNIEVVGVIDRPPAGTELANRTGYGAPIADVLAADATDVWSPLLEPVMTRLALRIRWWQLGRDYDVSFAALADPTKTLNQLRTALFRFGQDVRVGLSWDADGDRQTSGKVGWDFEQLCSTAPSSSQKLAELVDRKGENTAARWILVEPPACPAEPGPDPAAARAVRFREFVMRLISAKEHGADAIFVPNPFDDVNGLMRANGMPGELLLPWRHGSQVARRRQVYRQHAVAGRERKPHLHSAGQPGCHGGMERETDAGGLVPGQ